MTAMNNHGRSQYKCELVPNKKEHQQKLLITQPRVDLNISSARRLIYTMLPMTNLAREAWCKVPVITDDRRHLARIVPCQTPAA